MKLVNVRAIVFIALLAIAFVWITPIRIINTFLYYKNGSSLKVNEYKINFKIGRWAYLGQDDMIYSILGESNFLDMEIYKNPKVNLDKKLNNCFEYKIEKKHYKHINIDLYICQEAYAQILYFKSPNNDFFATSTINKNFSQDLRKKFDSFFNNISKN